MVKTFTQVEHHLEELARLRKAWNALSAAPNYGSQARADFEIRLLNDLWKAEVKYPASWLEAVRLVQSMRPARRTIDRYARHTYTVLLLAIATAGCQDAILPAKRCYQCQVTAYALAGSSNQYTSTTTTTTKCDLTESQAQAYQQSLISRQTLADGTTLSTKAICTRKP